MKTILTTLALMTMTFVAAPASADWECSAINGVGVPIDTRGGDTNADNPWAGCDGTWRDAYLPQAGAVRLYAQVCIDDGANAWVCPNPDPFNPWNVNDASCVPVTV